MASAVAEPFFSSTSSDLVKPAHGLVGEAPAFDVFVFHEHDGPLFVGTPAVQDGPCLAGLSGFDEGVHGFVVCIALTVVQSFGRGRRFPARAIRDAAHAGRLGRGAKRARRLPGGTSGWRV